MIIMQNTWKVGKMSFSGLFYYRISAIANPIPHTREAGQTKLKTDQILF